MSAGRPYKDINWKRVDFLIKADCTAKEIAGDLRLSLDTFYDAVQREKGMNFSNYSNSLQEAGVGLLKATQYAKAVGASKDGDTQLLMWLGKVRLKQKEPENENIITAPNEDFLKLQDDYIKLKYEMEQIKSALQPETIAVLQRSDSPV
jgi:hypothetical protein